MNIVTFIKSSSTVIILTLFLHTSASSMGSATSDILANPLITGASVSADVGTISPGKTLALRHTNKTKIKTIAFGGQPGRQVIHKIQLEDFKNRSIIIAIDFFFWDSTLPALNPSIEALESLISLAAKNKLPIVLGEIPELLPGKQVSRIRLIRSYSQIWCIENQAASCF